ncbi:right-handed parallel beta-helix repeat-containing protein [Pedobacter nyackensis]|uniref:right-handed parallel beta-helix repeat-containing protein n=1 Tax=Pedobacter nyackensis TaxID=475255 RepID=UPI002930C3CF|nr:right-handed parallel beta-helix repeat-containing protein [Pedobacter nyackensis]
MERLNLCFRITITSLVFFLVPLLCSAQGNNIYVSSFGAKGDGKTDDTRAINAAVLSAAKNSAKLYFEKNKTYLVDTVSLVGTKATPFQKLEIIGNNANIKCINRGSNNVFKFFFVNGLSISNLNISGNKAQKKDGNGLAVYYSKDLRIVNCKIQDCKFSGILIAWVKSANVSKNLIFNNGDGTLPSDGVSVHSLYQGNISSNVIYNNNPLDTQDGDGIQIGSIKYGITGYYDVKSIQKIEINNNICYLHGRRGIKIQRSNVVAENNFLSDNAIGVSIVNGLDLINNIQVKSNVIQKSYKGITLDGGGKQNISDVNISDNYLLGSIMTDRILLQDASGIKIARNTFDRHRIKVFDAKKKMVNYSNILVSKNVQDVDSSQSRLVDLNGSVSILATKLPSVGLNKIENDAVLRNIIAKTTNYKAPINGDVFCVFNNAIVNRAKVVVSYKGTSTPYILDKNKILVIYSFENKLFSFRY